ncbi:protein-tyrosine phosphatase family protein [Glutamicibacter ardleyensis]|jgi:protein-tyrosine phosphatase|uniref:protein-tyrosine phosphatase family protein n=1 Tax=Glutamicibacter ardleyensis TaxID=225894 RepID=UPI00166BDCDE|nr:protein-tyrosine phosphatase family protein [Glutamicibacter ardleyensis]
MQKGPGQWTDGSQWPADEPGLVRLPDGKQLRGASLKRSKALNPPDFGVYLLGRDPQFSDREYRWVQWRDFSTPKSTQSAVAALREAYRRASFQRVEVSCRGGVGRTGTALAVLAVLGGVSPADAVPWVKENYHPQAVETFGQRRWLKRLLPVLAR